MEPAKGLGALTLTMVLGVLMDGIDGSIVNVALPSVAYSFGTDTGAVSWVTICYFMMLAGFLLPFGKVAAAGHIRKVFLTGFLVFTVSSLACGLAPTLPILVTARVIQGIGAAALAAVAPMICVKLLPSAHLGRSLGIMTVASSMGFALGPALGGVLVEWLSWHWIFLINVPIGIAALILGHFSLPRESSEPVSVDARGSAILFAAVACGVIALERMSYPGEALLCVVLAIITIILVVVFALLSMRSRDPLIDVRLFRLRDMDLNLMSYTLVCLVYMGALYILPFYMEQELGLSSLMSGAVLFIPSFITLVLCVPVGNYSDRRGRRGCSLLANVFALAYSVILLIVEPAMGLPLLIAAVVLMGLNWGFCGAASTGRIVDSIPEEHKAIGSSLMNFMVYLGMTVGTALFASLLTSGGGSGGVPVDQMTSDMFMAGMEMAMVSAVILSAAALLMGVLAREGRDA